MKIVFGSDFHVGNSRIPYDNFLLNFETYLYPELKDCNGFIVGGDFFDRMIKMDERSAHVAVKFITSVLELAEQNKMSIKILRGTFSHDRNQNEMWITLSEGMDVDIEYINTLSIGVIKTNPRLRVLYIPDNLPYNDINDCLNIIRELMQNANWDKIDFVIGHGYFRHVLPKNILHEPKCTFRYEQFENIVKHHILFGHVHTPSTYKNIHYAGSFERFAHGEEESKGFIVIENNELENEYIVRRVWNKDTTPFVTITINNPEMDFDMICRTLEEFVKNRFIPKLWGYLRIRCDDPEVRQKLEIFANHKWGEVLTISTISNKMEQMKETFISRELEFESNNIVVPTKENISELTYNYLQIVNKTNGYSLNDIEKAIKALF